MATLGKLQARWEKVEEGRKLEYALRKDGSLVYSATTGDAEPSWDVVSETDATPDLEEVHKRMVASDFTLVAGDVPEPEVSPEAPPVVPAEVPA